MSDRPPLRRPEFDSITMGWGADSIEDLTARIELAAEWCQALGGIAALTPAEKKIVQRMIERQVMLGIQRGDFEPHLPKDADVFGGLDGK